MPHLPLPAQHPVGPPVPPPELWGQGDSHPACNCEGGWGLPRVVCTILRATGFQDQLLPSASRCLTTQSHIHSPHLPPGGTSSHFRLSLGLHLTPAEPCFLLCQGQHRCPLQAGFRDLGRGIGQCGKGRERGLRGSSLLSNRNTGCFSVASGIRMKTPGY